MGVATVWRADKACFWAGLRGIVGCVSRNSSSSETPRSTPVVTGVELAVTTPSLRSPRPKGRDVASLIFLRGLLLLDAIRRFLPKPWGRKSLAARGKGVR